MACGAVPDPGERGERGSERGRTQTAQAFCGELPVVSKSLRCLCENEVAGVDSA